MKILKLKKIVAFILAAVSVFTLHALSAEAAWVKNSNGWWNTEGNSWSVGWKFINNKWYYFDVQGYMKTGWVLDGGKWYYLNSDGSMAKNTTIDGYKIGADGVWIEETEIFNDITMNGLLGILRERGYKFEFKDAEKGFLQGNRKIVDLGDEKIELYIYPTDTEMEADAKNIYKGGFSYKKPDGENLKLSWDSYPHFYKNNYMIVIYVGNNKKIISDLNDCLGKHFLGIEYRESLDKVDDVRKIACKHLKEEFSVNEDIEDMWRSCPILDSNQSAIPEENEYSFIYQTDSADRCGVSLDKDTFEETSSIMID